MPQDAANRELKTVPEGWDHEQCELCNSHLDPNDSGYRDSMDRRICLRFYEHYVKTHDLSLVDDL